MMMTRRELLLAGAGAVAAMAAPTGKLFAAETDKRRLGIGTHSYSVRLGTDRDRPEAEKFHEPLRFLDYCHALGAGGIQCSLGVKSAEYCAQLRDRAAGHGMYVEGSLSLPREQADLARFEQEVRTAKEVGAKVMRTVMLSGRRYETFSDADSFRQFAERSYKSLTWAEPVLAKHDVRLAIENHKDWRVDEMLTMLKHLDSRHVGVLIDTGNSISLLEDPWETVDAYAPYATGIHIKDMAVAEYPEGFLLSEVALGQGFLDVPRIVERVRRAQPEVQFTLEMITRDPLQVPCLTQKYWVTFENLSGKHLARHLAMVRANVPKQPLPRISNLSAEEKAKVEDDNVRQCLTYAHEKLGL